MKTEIIGLKRKKGMTFERFAKLSYRHSMQMIYHHPQMDEPLLCMLIAVDFQNEMFCLDPLPDERLEQYPQHDYSFWCPIDKVDIAPKNLKITHKSA